MNNPDYERFIQECQQLPYLVDAQKDAAEEYISAYLADPQNSDAIRTVMETEQNAQIKLIMIETIGKVILTKGKGKVTHVLENGVARSLYTTETHLPEEGLFTYFFELIKYLLNYIKLNYNSNPKFITNSVANVVATYLEVQAYNSGPVKSMSELILEEFFGYNCVPSDYYIGLKLSHYAINNIIIASANYNFFRYRKMLLDFQTGILYDIFTATKNAVKFISTNITEGEANKNAIELLTLALEVYFKCLTYPFSLSYFDYKEEFNLEEVTILLFPEGYVEGLVDFELYDTLLRLLQMKISREISLEITRILSRCAASRTSIMNNDQTKQQFKAKMVEAFIQMVYNCPLDEEVFVSEILEAILRIIFVAGTAGIVYEPIVKENFKEAANTLSDAIIVLAYRLDSKLAQQLIEFWKKIKPNKESLSSLQLIGRFLENYFEYNFNERQKGSFFPESVKSFKRLKECVEQSFEYFRDLIMFNVDASCKLWNCSVDVLVSQFNSAAADPNSFDVYISKVGHFILLFTQTFLKTDGYTTYTLARQDSVELNYFNTSVKICFVLFDLIGKITAQIQHLENPLYRGYILSTLYFFEIFTSIAIGNIIYNSEQDCLILDEGLFKCLVEEYKLAPSFEAFFDQLTGAIINNLGYKNYSVTKASLTVIRIVVDRLKRIFNGRKKDKLIFDTLCNKLIDQNNLHLADAKCIKLRTNLYEVIGVCYLDERYPDYIENCHLVLNQVLENNKVADDQIDLKRVLYDLNGVYRAISYTKVISVFTKICYPKIQDLLSCYGSEHLSDSSFVVLLIDFYANLFERSTQNFQVNQSQTVTFKIISDACKMISMLLSELNGAIEKLNDYDSVLQFVTANIKLVKKFLIAFESLLKNSDISFSVFHFFGNQEFLNFSRSIFRFLYLVSSCLISHFPDKQQLFFGVLKDGIRCLSDYMLEFFYLEEIENIFKMVLMIFDKRMTNLVNEGYVKTNVEDLVIEDLAMIIRSLLVSLYQEYRIYIDNQTYREKLKGIIVNNTNLAVEFSLKALELAQLTNSSVRQITNLSDIMFFFVVVFQDGDVLNTTIQQLVNRESDESVRDGICLSFEGLSSKLKPTIDDSNREEFTKHFNAFIKYLSHAQKRKYSHSQRP